MNKTLQENNYIFVDNFISKEESQNLYKQFKKDIEDFPNDFIADCQCPKSFAMYNYKLFLELLINKISHVSELIDEPVMPTYSYARLYQKGEVLKKHIDGKVCEISVTLNLGGDKDWEIFFTKPNGEQVPVNVKPGQAAIYLGRESIHWREEFKGKEYAQVFLHYVRNNGPYWRYYFDKVNEPR
jgi:hypothetical protein